MMKAIQFPALGAIASGFLVSLAFAPAPALAFDEGRGSTFESLIEMFGLAEKKEDAIINYRERAPLVLPPKTNLPAPRPSASREGNWPQDQEVVAQRKRIAAAKVGRARDESDPRALVANPANHVPGPAGRAGPPTECKMSTDPAETNNCSPAVFWKGLDAKKEEKQPLQAGVEPDRRYLTQPPKGYYKVQTTQKATFEPPKEEEGHHTDYFREQKQREQ